MPLFLAPSLTLSHSTSTPKPEPNLSNTSKPLQFPLTHDKLDGINFKRLLSSLSSCDWKVGQGMFMKRSCT
jgi:hypothetical protein